MGNGWSKYTTEDGTALTSKFNFMQCLTLAYNERAEFAGISQLPAVHHLDENPVNFCKSFDASLDNLIPCFGKIVSGVYVSYTVTSIYTELAETRLDSRLPAYKLNPIYYRLWFEQVIRVINKLQLSLTSCGYSPIQAESSFGYKKNGVVTIYDNNISYVLGHYSDYRYVLGFYDYTSTNTKIKLLHPFIRNSTATLNISAIVGWRYSDYNVFNAGISGFSEGLNQLFNDISVSIDNSGYFLIPDIPGEGNTNFIESIPAYPEEQGYTFIGYTINSFYIGGTGNFQFIAGS